MITAPVTKWSALVASFVLACAPVAAAQVEGSQRDVDDIVFERLRQPPAITIPSGVPEDRRDFYLSMVEVKRELQSLQPWGLQRGLAVLQEMKELEKRSESSLGEWAEALRRRYTSPEGIAGTLVLIENIGGRDGLEGMSAEEREVRLGGVQKRLIGLAITGRIAKEEYDSFVKRVRGN
jgi:hypothetical protein